MVFITVWLRNAFPFDLLSDSDSFLYSDDTLQSSPDPRSSLSPNTNMSSSQSKRSTLQVSPSTRTLSPKVCSPVNSTQEFELVNNTGNQQAVFIKTPQGANVDTGTPHVFKNSPLSQLCDNVLHDTSNDVKVSACTSSSSSPNSVTPSPDKDTSEPTGHRESKFHLFTKLKAAVKRRKDNLNGTGSGIHVGSYSSSEKGNSSSLSSFFSSRRSTPRVLTYSSSVSSPKGDNHTLKSDSHVSPLPVIDIIKAGENELYADTKHETDDLQKTDASLKSEGFEVLSDMSKVESKNKATYSEDYPKSDGFEVENIDNGHHKEVSVSNETENHSGKAHGKDCSHNQSIYYSKNTAHKSSVLKKWQEGARLTFFRQFCV